MRISFLRFKIAYSVLFVFLFSGLAASSPSGTKASSGLFQYALYYGGEVVIQEKQSNRTIGEKLSRNAEAIVITFINGHSNGKVDDQFPYQRYADLHLNTSKVISKKMGLKLTHYVFFVYGKEGSPTYLPYFSKTIKEYKKKRKENIKNKDILVFNSVFFNGKLLFDAATTSKMMIGKAEKQYVNWLSKLWVLKSFKTIGIHAFTEKDFKKARRYFMMLSKYNDSVALYLLGSIASKEGKHKEAFSWYKKSALNNHRHAAFVVGKSYKQGKGVTKNIDKAVVFFTQAVKAGHADAALELGFIYSDDSNKKFKDYKKSIYWFEVADKRGVKSAAKMLRLTRDIAKLDSDIKGYNKTINDLDNILDMLDNPLKKLSRVQQLTLGKEMKRRGMDNFRSRDGKTVYLEKIHRLARELGLIK